MCCVKFRCGAGSSDNFISLPQQERANKFRFWPAKRSGEACNDDGAAAEETVSGARVRAGGSGESESAERKQVVASVLSTFRGEEAALLRLRLRLMPRKRLARLILINANSGDLESAPVRSLVRSLVRQQQSATPLLYFAPSAASLSSKKASSSSAAHSLWRRK